jgi:hypothetical protein
MAGGGVSATPGVRKTGSQSAALLSDPADAGGAATTSRSRRRVGWRKGAEIDQELWPAEAFGGVTDEQFWDDLAADKPLAKTARTAQPNPGSRSQPDPGSRRRLPDAVPLPDGRAGLSGARSDWTATAPAPIVTRPIHPAGQPAESARLPGAATGGFADSRINVDEDPLTSPAYSLRPRGAVDGRSYQSSRTSRGPSREQYEAAISQTTQTFSLADSQAAGGGYRSDPLRSDGYWSDPLRSGGYWSGLAGSSGSVGTIPTPAYQASLGSTVSYPHPEQTYGGSIHSMNTPPYGEMFGYGNPVGLVGDPRRPNGTWGYGQPGGGAAGDGNWGSRYAYPPAAGHREPYDPRTNGRR